MSVQMTIQDNLVRLIYSSPVSVGFTLLYIFIMSVFLIRNIKSINRENEILTDNLSEISNYREQLDSAKCWSKSLDEKKLIFLNHLKTIGNKYLREKITKYYNIVIWTGTFYDPEVFIRQEFEQEEHLKKLKYGQNFTKWGLLGTFLGLVVGLLNINTASSETLSKSIETTLGGMVMAFATSLVGILCSIIYDSKVSMYIKNYELWEDALSQLLGQHLAVPFIRRPENALTESAEKLSAAGQQIVKAVSQFDNSFINFNTTIERISSATLEFTEVITHQREVTNQLSSSVQNIFTAIEADIKKQLIVFKQVEIVFSKLNETQVESINRIEKAFENLTFKQELALSMLRETLQKQLQENQYLFKTQYKESQDSILKNFNDLQKIQNENSTKVALSLENTSSALKTTPRVLAHMNEKVEELLTDIYKVLKENK